jgi:hypothetical protein
MPQVRRKQQAESLAIIRLRTGKSSDRASFCVPDKTRWRYTRGAMTNGLDEVLGTETEETREVPRPWIYKQRIRLGRLRRARQRLG